MITQMFILIATSAFGFEYAVLIGIVWIIDEIRNDSKALLSEISKEHAEKNSGL